MNRSGTPRTLPSWSVVKSVDDPSTVSHSGAHVLRGGGAAARVRPWPGSPRTAHLVTLDLRTTLHPAVLRSWLHQLGDLGYTRIRTGAIRPAQRSPYDALGFTMAQELALLQFDSHLAGTPRVPAHLPPTGVRIRRGRPSDAEALAELDRHAFPPGWGLDADGVLDAIRATPYHRIAVALRLGDAIGDRMPLGYAISGRGGRAMYLQRLAVVPAARRLGVGALLVADGLRWAQRWRSNTVTVNTQSDNTAALDLYQRAGFVLQPTRLVVLERSLDNIP